MKKTKLLLFIICSSLLLLTACGDKNTDKPKKTDTKEDKETTAVDEKIKKSLKGLTKDEYKDLEINCEVLLRSAILPGSTIPLTITVTNKGDKNVIYTQGSGSFETPQALMIDVPKLQPILPQDYLGVATMDIRNQELLPGETIKHTLFIKAIKPSEKFNEYTHNKWDKDQIYIADMDWETLKKEHDDLSPAKAGKYKGTVYFLYHTGNNEQSDPMSGATGYSTGNASITIVE